MADKKIGDFLVSTEGEGSKEALLFTHGGYKAKWGMAGMDSSVYFYAPHTATIKIPHACDIIDQKGKAEPKSIASANSSIWNYHLQAFDEKETKSVTAAWKSRIDNKELSNWDWWRMDPSLGRKNMSDMKALKKAMEGYNYDVIHFLCCREWFEKNAPKDIAGISAPG